MSEIQILELSTDMQSFFLNWDCIVNVAIFVVHQLEESALRWCSATLNCKPASVSQICNDCGMIVIRIN